MLPLNLLTLKPLLEQHARLLLITSGAEFGASSLTNENHLIDRFSAFASNLDNPAPYDIHGRYSRVATRDKSDRIDQGQNVHPDIILGSNHQHKSVETLLRKNRSNVSAVRPYLDFQTYSLYPALRGFERKLAKLISQLDDESINQEYLEPELNDN